MSAHSVASMAGMFMLQDHLHLPIMITRIVMMGTKLTMMDAVHYVILTQAGLAVVVPLLRQTHALRFVGMDMIMVTIPVMMAIL